MHSNSRRAQRNRSAASAALLAAALLSAGAAGAAPTYPPAVQAVQRSGATVIRQFPAASGLTGWVLAHGGRETLAFSTADGKTLMFGTLVDENGQNLSMQYSKKYVGGNDAASLFGRLGKSAYITEGETKNPKQTIYVFFDANCPYCHLTWIALQPYEKAGLQVRWIPIAVLGPTSMPKATEMLGGADPTAEFRKLEQAPRKKEWKPSGKVDELRKAELEERILANGQLMQAFDIGGTPGLVWKDAHGKVQVLSGMPSLKQLPAITGLPEQPEDDPALAKYR